MKRKMIVTLAACGLLTAGLVTGCGQEAAAPAEPPREVIVGDDVSESSAQTEEGNIMKNADWRKTTEEGIYCYTYG